MRYGQNFQSAIVSLLCPRKTPFLKVFARPFSKGRVLRVLRVPPAYPVSSRAVLFAAREDVRGAFGSEEDNGGDEGHYPREGDNAAVDEA